MVTIIAISTAMLFILACILLINIKKNGESDKPKEMLEATELPYYAKTAITAIEKNLYYRLMEALPDYVILYKVQLSVFLGVRTGFDFNEWNNKINRMNIDFVVCDKYGSVKAVIEFNDSAPKNKDRIINDSKRDKAIIAAGIKIIRWGVQDLPNRVAIQLAVL